MNATAGPKLQARGPSVMDPDRLLLADTYARALLETIDDNARADELNDELNDMVRLLDEIDGAEALLTGALLTRTERCELVERVFGGRVGGDVEAFLGVLARRGRLDVLRPAAERFGELLNDRKGRTEVELTTAVPLGKSKQSEIARSIAESLGAEIVLDVSVDENVIGGAKMRIGDKVYDATIGGALKGLLRRLAGRVAGADDAAAPPACLPPPGRQTENEEGA